MRATLSKIWQSIKAATRIGKYPYWWINDMVFLLSGKQVKDIPVVINNFNRLTFPQQLISFLESCGSKNIIILDNNSTYPPLLQYYGQTKHLVINNGVNYGHLALWKSGLYDKLKWGYFAYTDSDVVPDSGCPNDFMQQFVRILRSNYQIDKVGFGIRIDDLPENFNLKSKVVQYEQRYWTRSLGNELYDAPIDTTFALYRPLTGLLRGEASTLKAWRTGFPYVVRHMPWYTDSSQLTDEEQYYVRTSNGSSSLGKQQKGEVDIY